jgi:hypothetical protein
LELLIKLIAIAAPPVIAVAHELSENIDITCPKLAPFAAFIQPLQIKLPLLDIPAQ